MYYGHFGLTQPPFRITPNTEFFFSGGNRGPILEALIYAIAQGEGIVKVTGEVGSGKTMLCNMLMARLPANVETVYIVNPSVSPEEILLAIALELQLKPPRGAGHLEIMQLLHQHLLERHAEHKQVVMFVEESQSMPISTLEEIRLLSNLETAHSKLLQIVLFGQPELEDNLRQPHIRQLRERITHSFRLSPLKNAEIREYLNFRLRAAGYRGPDLFSSSIISAIAKASDGLTRRINLIADKALLAAFSENTHTLKSRHVKAAVRDSEFSHYESPQRRFSTGMALSLLVFGAGIGIALYALFQLNPLGTLSAPPPVPAAIQPAATPGATAAPETKPAEAPVQAPPAAGSAVIGSPLGAVAAQPPAADANTTPTATDPEKPLTKQENAGVSAHSQGGPLTLDGVDARLAATKAWLAQQSDTTYSIQLLGADNPQQLRNHLNNIRKYVEINDIFVYRTVAKQKPSLTVLYGSYSDRRVAQDALASLPASLKVYKPIIRTVQGIRAEIALHQSS
jgi:MSHA biogenesis protein MshM